MYIHIYIVIYPPIVLVYNEFQLLKVSIIPLVYFTVKSLTAIETCSSEFTFFLSYFSLSQQSTASRLGRLSVAENSLNSIIGSCIHNIHSHHIICASMWWSKIMHDRFMMCTRVG